MKKSVIYFVCFWVISFISLSVKADSGIKGGLCVSIVYFLDRDEPFLGYELNSLDYWALFSYQLGLFKTISLSKKWGLQPEFNYTVKRVGLRKPYIYDNLKIKIHYLEIPLLLRFNFSPGKRMTSFFFFGPYLGVKLRAKKIEHIWQKEREIHDLKKIKPINYGLIFGGGTEFYMFSKKFIVDLRGCFGLPKIVAQPEEYNNLAISKFYDDTWGREISVILSFGYFF